MNMRRCLTLLVIKQIELNHDELGQWREVTCPDRPQQGEWDGEGWGHLCMAAVNVNL